MDSRQDYVAPAIAWEGGLEQTSLACNATLPWEAEGPAFTGPADDKCVVDAAKGGSFVQGDRFCDAYFQFPADVLVLS
jgi:hypothetical protein